ncbi:MAG: hypothetical protein HY692_04790 [Cyanobacteria bacterium NC_groundwater_1444_Ag_S-0.65um_54_12]|nr:hypothetical protein [Cyanobacteria bacterium NC_groundwater_1444_Ag_S-0.65um_54_12]
MSQIILNGQLLRAMSFPVNSLIETAAQKNYLDRHPDGLDSYRVTVDDQQFLIVGKGLPQGLVAADRLEIAGRRAKLTFTENEVNSASEGARNSISSRTGAITLLTGAAISSLAGYLTLAITSTSLTCSPLLALIGIGIVGGLLSLAALGLYGAIKATWLPIDQHISTHLAKPKS